MAHTHENDTSEAYNAMDRALADDEARAPGAAATRHYNKNSYLYLSLGCHGPGWAPLCEARTHNYYVVVFFWGAPSASNHSRCRFSVACFTVIYRS